MLYHIMLYYIIRYYIMLYYIIYYTKLYYIIHTESFFSTAPICHVLSQRSHVGRAVRSIVFVNAISEPIRSGNRQLSDKIITLHNNTLNSSDYVVSNGRTIRGMCVKVAKQFEAAPEVPCGKHDKANRWLRLCVRPRGHSCHTCTRVHIGLTQDVIKLPTCCHCCYL